jgi:hypothetical protein
MNIIIIKVSCWIENSQISQSKIWILHLQDVELALQDVDLVDLALQDAELALQDVGTRTTQCGACIARCGNLHYKMWSSH